MAQATYQAVVSPTTNGQCSPNSTPVRDLWLGFDTEWPADERARVALRDAKRKVATWFNDGFDHGAALVLAGGYGSGKTHLARVVLGASAPHVTHMVSEADLLANIKATYDGDGSEKIIIATYRRAPLLIIDDVGAGHVNPESMGWLQDIYWRIMDRRAELHLPLMMTTNLNFAELGKRLGGRALSRLQGMMPEGAEHVVSLFSVPDYRARGWK
jgi:DNA replication protein DnaC